MAPDSKSASLAPLFAAIATVVIDRGPNKPLDYGVTAEHHDQIEVGKRVLVPIKTQLRAGTVIAIKTTASPFKMRPVARILSEKSFLSAKLFSLAQWMSAYYCTPMRQVLTTLLPSSIRGEVKEKKQLCVYPKAPAAVLRLALEEKRRTRKSQAQVLELILSHPQGILLSKLVKKTSVSTSPIRSLTREDLIEVKELAIERSPLESFEFFPTKPKKLNAEQASCLATIQTQLASNTFHTHLIHGITGSGKTEIYIQAMEIARKSQRGIILLVPEIALTSQTIERLKSRFQEKIGVVHSRLSSGERFDMWHSMRQGKTPIVIGARSAVFSPIPNLGLIIVDEEHDSSYKQTEEQPCYHARDVAIMRGKLSAATVLLGSATPSLESYAHAQAGKYFLTTLRQRATKATLPKVCFVDMKKEWAKKRGYQLLSEPLIQAIKQRFTIGEQTLLFLNRRGYQTAQICKNCGQTLKCPHCDASLTFHKKNQLSCCHFCSFTLSPPPTTCPHCRQTGYLEYKGIGTQKVERALGALLPSIRILRMDADTTQRKGSHDALLKQFRSGKADVLIGTQMIAKGLHFPNVTLVGILNSDSALHIPDFRASETLFQLLIQVAGRAGRSEIPGEVIIQTCLEKHPVFALAAKCDYSKFFTRELEGRKSFHFPPFTRLTKLIFSGPNESETRHCADHFHRALTSQLDSSFTLYPAIPCGYAKIKDRYRFKLVIKGSKIYTLNEQLLKLQQRLPLPRKIRLLIDTDPISTF
ncbi:MAG: primosomal protein N' [Chlamydiota bacterium]